jgi:AcrR family transcriptional regulator
VQQAVERRAYDSSRRQAAAYERRLAIIEAARRLFTDQGYAVTTMADIAHEAAVNVDTLYAGVGTKPELFALLIDMALSGTAEEIPAEQRNYVARIQTEPDPSRKLEIYAAAVTAIWERIAALLNVLQAGAAEDAALAEIWESFQQHRADNLRLLIDELQPIRALRSGLDPAAAAESAWAVSSTEVYLLLTGSCGWSVERYRDWLADSFKRLLLN